MAYETEDHETLYCFPAFNSSCVKEKRSTHEYYIMYVFSSLLSAWTVFLNLLVIISISHFKKLHTPTNLLILSLAVADLLVGLIVMPVEAMKLIESCWYFDNSCSTYLLINGLILTASLFSLVLIAIDRYVAVCHPLLYPRKITTTRTVIFICLCWVFSMMYSSAVFIDGRYFDTTQKVTVCYGNCFLSVRFFWIVFDLILCFIFPCTLMISLYLRIFYVAHQQVKVINSLLKSGKCVTEGSVRRKSESKAALTLGIIVTVYLVCFIPYYICSLTSSAETATLFNVLLCIMILNSGLNPLIYALFYPWFRKSTKIILTLNIFQQASSQMSFTKSRS